MLDSADAQSSRDAEVTALIAAASERADAERQSAAARERQDDDYHAVRIDVDFTIAGNGENAIELSSEGDPNDWLIEDDEAAAADTKSRLLEEVRAALAPLLEHFGSVGLIRGDGIEGEASSPMFYLVHEPALAGIRAATLGELPAVERDLSSLPGGRLTITLATVATNATYLFDAARRADAAAIGRWGGSATPELMPRADEGRDAWLARVAMPAERLARTVERWQVSGRSIEIFRAFGNSSERASGDSEIAWLVEGVIPRGAITILAGSSAAGKSSLAHSWIAALAGYTIDRPRSILGVEVTGRYTCALIAGEDPDGVISDRDRRHATIWGGGRYVSFTDPTRGIDFYLELLEGMPVLDFVVIDPVRAFFEGDEKSTADAGAFCSKLAAFARAKDCAVLLVHHITKGGARDQGECRSLGELKQRIRGSTAFVDASRMVIGIVPRKDGTVEVGPVKYNYPAETVWARMGEAVRFVRNPDTFTLDPIGQTAAKAACARETGEDAPTSRVLAAVQRCNRSGITARKSGKFGLYECRMPELAGLSRAAVLQAVAELLSSGQLSDGEAGLLARGGLAGDLCEVPTSGL